MGGRSRVKRKAVASADGWTVITHGLAGLSVSEAEHDEKKQDASAMPGVTPGLTVEALLADFRAWRGRWRGAAPAEQVRRVVLGGEKGWCVGCAVGIGLGSLSRDWEHRYRCMWQLVLFIEVVGLLREQGLAVDMYAQDPAFTSLDKEFLGRLEIKVTETIEQHVSSAAFVFSPFVDWYLLLPGFLKDKSPELYIGNEILDDYTAYAQTADKKKKLEECNELGREFLRNREMIKLADFELHAHALNGIVMYWKQTAEDDKQARTVDTPS